MPWFRSLGNEPGRERRVFDDHPVAGAPVEPDPIRTELLDRDETRRGVVAVKEVRGVASGRVGEGMRTLVHTESLLGHRRCAALSALLALPVYREAVTKIASLGTRTASPSWNDANAAITSSCSRCCSCFGRTSKPLPSGVVKFSRHVCHSISGSAM